MLQSIWQPAGRRSLPQPTPSPPDSSPTTPLVWGHAAPATVCNGEGKTLTSTTSLLDTFTFISACQLCIGPFNQLLPNILFPGINSHTDVSEQLESAFQQLSDLLAQTQTSSLVFAHLYLLVGGSTHTSSTCKTKPHAAPTWEDAE